MFCGDDHDYVVSGQHIYAGGEQLTVSRRDLLRGGAAAVVAGGAAALFAQAPAAAQAPPPASRPRRHETGRRDLLGQQPRQRRSRSAFSPSDRDGAGRRGMKFKALVRHENTLTTETLTLLPLHPLHVVIRMQASQTCYSTTGSAQHHEPRAQFAAVAGHGGVGIVEEVGRLVKRVKVGDQVMLATTPNCGVCWNCLSGRGDLLQHATARDSERDDVGQHAGLHERAAGRAGRILGNHRVGRGLGRAALHAGAADRSRRCSPASAGPDSAWRCAASRSKQARTSPSSVSARSASARCRARGFRARRRSSASIRSSTAAIWR